MNTFYALARAVAGSAQPNLDGGIFAFALEHTPQLLTGDNASFANIPLAKHFASTISSGGFFAGIFFGVFWCIGLLSGFCLLWWMRYRKPRSNFTLPSSANSVGQSIEKSRSLQNEGTKLHNGLQLNGFHSDSASKSIFFMTRRRLQSRWLCLACQFVTIFALIFLLLFFSVLGVVVSTTLHMNLVTEPNYNVTTPLISIDGAPRQNHLFPGILTAVAHTKAYLTEFLNSTREETSLAVDQLIDATAHMQDRKAAAFNELLFEKMGIRRAFELGDKLGAHTVKLMQLALPLKKHVHEYADTVSDLNMAIARWTGFMEQLDSERNSPTCFADNNCASAGWVLSDLSVRSDWRLTHFDFAIALNFVTDVQNKTPESIEAELTRGRSLADEQLRKTMLRMQKELNIRESITNLVDAQWEDLSVQLRSANVAIDNSTSILLPRAFDLAVFASTHFLVVGCVVWTSMILIAFSLTWLLWQYHCVTVGISKNVRHRARFAESFILLFLVIATCFTCALFTTGGYAHTEVCRYITPGSPATVVPADFMHADGAHLRVHFALDVHFNSFLDRNWDKISEYASKVQADSKEALPLPRLQNPIKALSVGCRDNLGILDAFDAVETFDFTVLNKPELTAKFAQIGRSIMRDTLNELDPNEMFPPMLTESIQMASRLDDFLIPFDAVRASLPRTFLNLTKSENGSLSNALLSEFELSEIWAVQRVVYNNRDSLTDTIARADELAKRVFDLSARITRLLDSIDLSLTELSKLKPIGQTVAELQKLLDNLIIQMNNKSEMITMAMSLFDEQVTARLPVDSLGLMRQNGPALIRGVGKCRRLYEAYTAATSAVCDGLVGPLNGLWFFTGFCVLLCTVLVVLSLCLLLHKLPMAGARHGQPEEKPNTNDAEVNVRNYPPPTSPRPPVSNGTRLLLPNSSDGDGFSELEPLHRSLLRDKQVA